MLIAAKCDIEAQDRYGMRALLMAAWHGHRDAVEMLINCGANVLAANKVPKKFLHENLEELCLTEIKLKSG